MNADVEEITRNLPISLRDQVYSYVNSVTAAADDIFAEAGIPRTDAAMKLLTTVAAIRKVFGIVGASYWAVSNALATNDRSTGTATNGTVIRIGGSSYGKGTKQFGELQALFHHLEKGLAELEILDLVRGGSYAEIIATVTNGHFQG